MQTQLYPLYFFDQETHKDPQNPWFDVSPVRRLLLFAVHDALGFASCGVRVQSRFCCLSGLNSIMFCQGLRPFLLFAGLTATKSELGETCFAVVILLKQAKPSLLLCCLASGNRSLSRSPQGSKKWRSCGQVKRTACPDATKHL